MTPARIERATYSLEGCCSIQLSYGVGIQNRLRPAPNRYDSQKSDLGPSGGRAIDAGVSNIQNRPLACNRASPSFSATGTVEVRVSLRYIESMQAIRFLFPTLFLLSSSFGQTMAPRPVEKQLGGIVRTDKSRKQINLAFTGHEFAEGGNLILSTLQKHDVKASFFFTGDFYRNTSFEDLITKLKADGHYLGAHSDKHLLYCPWENRDSLLVTKKEFITDLLDNYKEMERFALRREDARFFMPPFEWYNDSISAWTKELGLTLVNFTPGTLSNADYTHPGLGGQYRTSDSIASRIMWFEENTPFGLNGFILLLHIGADPRRPDPFYRKLDDLIHRLKSKGYEFTLLHQTNH